MRTQLRYALIIFIILPPLLLNGCAGLGKRLEPPRITLANIQVQELKVFESIFQVEIRIFNTNDMPFEIKGIDCDLELNDRKFASGVANTKIKIPAFGTTTVPLVLYSSVLDVLKSLQGFKQKEDLKYKFSGKIHIVSGFLVPGIIPFRSDGQISLEGITAENR
ncbi:MAG: LEA type 2 family protein [Desulfobacterales bacterium]|nr:LEA type 2 family protein [Desulfobacterales bacterium]